MQHNLAIAHGRFGSILFALGHLEQSLASLRQAQSSLEDLVKIDSTNVTWRNDLAVSYERLAQLRQQRKQYGEAASFKEKSQKIRRAIAVSDPSNGRAQQQLAVDLINLASLKKVWKGSRHARGHVAEAVKILAALVHNHPDYIQWQDDYENARRLLSQLER